MNECVEWNAKEKWLTHTPIHTLARWGACMAMRHLHVCNDHFSDCRWSHIHTVICYVVVHAWLGRAHQWVQYAYTSARNCIPCNSKSGSSLQRLFFWIFFFWCSSNSNHLKLDICSGLCYADACTVYAENKKKLECQFTDSHSMASSTLANSEGQCAFIILRVYYAIE